MHDLRSKASRARFALSPVALVVAGLLQPNLVQAQPAADVAQARPQPAAEPSPSLKPSPALREDIPAPTRDQLPTFVRGDSIRGRTDLETEIEGNAELRRGDTILRANKLQYDQATDRARASGDVRINKAGTVFEGPLLDLKIDAFEGFFNEPRYRFLQNNAYGEADRIDFIDDKRAIIRNATYTTCQRKPGPSWLPDWILRASSIRIDQETEVGHAEGAVLSFMGLPILPVPAMSFPLSDARKSGVLPPTFGLDNVSGVELTVPYYWNIAPNRDATFYPTLMSKRGVDLAGEARYLEPLYSGTWRANVLPNDRLRDRDRWGYSVRHDQYLQLPAGIGGVGLNLNVNRVSDDNYWRDFSRSGVSLTQRLLAGEGSVSWGRGDFSFVARATKWQTLQDLSAPIVPPYDRAPQLIGRYSKSNLWGGLETSIETDHTRFSVDGTLNGQPNARRTFTYAQVSRPWQAPGWFVTPKVQLHARHYDFDTPIATGAGSASVTVPTASLDSGLVFERDASFFGRAFRQTLEPRAFYVYTPFRDQNALPNYDSAAHDFNFATIWTENAFGGHDRIADNNLLTLGLTTRLLDPDTGAEAARFGVAQRVRFKDQRVTLPGGAPVSERLSDILFGASVNWVPQWTVDSTIQYNPKEGRSIRSTIGGRYSPGNYRVVSAAYRLQRGSSEQLDLGWQWPLNDLWGDRGQNLGPGMGEGEGRWYSVGRLNYSMKDRRVVDAVVGLEYDAGCWLGRIVFERLQAGTQQSNKRVLFQLEFLGFTRLGSNALQSLKDNIPRYQFLREQVRTPSRFSNYD
ncbi:LPS-assembly protein LptD [Caenimonas sedimenti]|uniref:LPS-assembly protein LptD n=1 Tax=Caenimonas sedimenti TaxID=2596921 RepID=A0A562ZR56_9BURK|nr:LPS-assembly protein LptD [Caenimonas sedimenti]TWO70841.1 LPS-assembly protein LptD [Caenimonas sedimenti]